MKDYMKARREARWGAMTTLPLSNDCPNYETSARKETKNLNNTLSIL